MPLRATGLGSNQDADSHRDQAIDREYEAQILGYCTWHQGWFNRETGKPVECSDRPVTHGVCSRCSAKEIARLRASHRIEAAVFTIFAAILFLAVSVSAEIKPASAETSPRTKADTYLFALGSVETGNNDMARNGTGGRFQFTRHEWVKFTKLPYSSATNPVTARNVVIDLVEHYTHTNVEAVTPEQFARAFHCPFAKQLNREQADYVQRFENLCK